MGAPKVDTPRSSQPHLPESGQRLGKSYELDELIGQGGMGAVYRATHVGLRRQFAVKVVSVFGQSPDAARRLVQEARTASAVEHDHIVDVTDLGHTAEGLVYVVMELLRGQDLSQRLEDVEGEGLPLDEARRIGDQILDGLVAAHEAGIVHRDLKPANVFLAEKRDRTVVKLLDFGMSKVTDVKSSVQITKTGDLIGTPLYMAPEQSRGDDMDHRSDLYSVGVVLYEILAGDVPFPATSVYECVLAHATGAPPPLRDVRPEVPEAVAEVVHRCLEKEPADRYATAAELRAAWNEAFGEPGAIVRSGEREAVPTPVASEPPAPEPRRGPWLSWGVGLAAAAAVAIALAWASGSRSTDTGSDSAPMAGADEPAADSIDGPQMNGPRTDIEPTEPGSGDEPAQAAGEPRSDPEPEPTQAAAPAPAPIRITSDPPRAWVYDGEERLGSTPFELPRPEDPRALRLVARGHRPRALELRPDSDEAVHVELAPVRVARDTSDAPELAPH